MKMIGDTPRRSRIDVITKEEKAIYQLTGEIEALGADPLLTDAVCLLEQARQRVADWVEQKTQPKLQDLLEMTVTSHGVDHMPVEVPPEFIVKVQEKTPRGVRIIIHADGHNSETLDYWVIGDALRPIDG